MGKVYHCEDFFPRTIKKDLPKVLGAKVVQFPPKAAAIVRSPRKQIAGPGIQSSLMSNTCNIDFSGGSK